MALGTPLVTATVCMGAMTAAGSGCGTCLVHHGRIAGPVQCSRVALQDLSSAVRVDCRTYSLQSVLAVVLARRYCLACDTWETLGPAAA